MANGGTGGSELTPAICRDNAKACRDLARRNSDPHQRKSLEEIAKAWDDLALELAKRD
jgi:hypothetical protein